MSENDLRIKLLHWFAINQRSLPWRKNRNWYTIWISEVMLQQTQVEQVIPYFNRFVKSFPTVFELAGASEQNVLKIWEGLGYYSRARNMLKSAQIVVAKYNGELPRDRTLLIKLPGFGDYITNAVLSLAFDLPLAVVDGNIKRIITRLYMIKDDIRKSQTQKKIQSIMDRLLPHKGAGEFNEAMMELGAVICLPRVPLCEKCSISDYCQAKINQVVQLFPYKSSKPKVPVINSVAFIVKHRDCLLIVKRPSAKMLGGLWEFPVAKLGQDQTLRAVDADIMRHEFGITGIWKKSLDPIKHAYSHFQLCLAAELYIVKSKKFQSDFYTEYRWCPLKELKQLPLHKVMWKILQYVETDLKMIA